MLVAVLPSRSATTFLYRGSSAFRNARRLSEFSVDISSPIRISVASESKTTRFRSRMPGTGRLPESPAASLKFYTHDLCPYAQRVAITLEEKGIPYEKVFVDLSNKPSWYLRDINPRGLVPAIQTLTQDKRVVTESLEICLFLDEFKTINRLMPEDGAEKTRAVEMLKNVDSLISAGLSLVAGPVNCAWSLPSPPPLPVSRSPPSPSHASLVDFRSREMRGKRERWEREMRVMEELLRRGREKGGAEGERAFLFGERISLVDIALFPFFQRFELALGHFFHSVVPSYPLSSSHSSTAMEYHDPCFTACGEFPLVEKWVREMGSRESAVKTFPVKQKFLSALQKYRSLDYFDFRTASLDNPDPS